jgi:hypothetical protein
MNISLYLVSLTLVSIFFVHIIQLSAAAQTQEQELLTGTVTLNTKITKDTVNLFAGDYCSTIWLLLVFILATIQISTIV